MYVMKIKGVCPGKPDQSYATVLLDDAYMIRALRNDRTGVIKLEAKRAQRALLACGQKIAIRWPAANVYMWQELC